MSTSTSTARVQVTVEVTVGSWGHDCRLDQLYRQAAQSAMEKVSRMIHEGGGKIIGAPKVTAVLAEPRP